MFFEGMVGRVNVSVNLTLTGKIFVKLRKVILVSLNVYR